MLLLQTFSSFVGSGSGYGGTSLRSRRCNETPGPPVAGGATSFLGLVASNPSGGRPSLFPREEPEEVREPSRLMPSGRPVPREPAVLPFPSERRAGLGEGAITNPETVAHPSPAELEGFLLGKISRPQVLRIVAHLLRGCGMCSRAIQPLASLIFSEEALVPLSPYRRSRRARRRENRSLWSKGGACRFPEESTR